MRKIGIPNCVLSLALLGLAPLGGCQSKVEAPAASPTSMTAKSKPVELARADTSPPGTRTGVGVKGLWKIKVLNADHSIAQQREFHNALTPVGILKLTRVLLGTRSVGGWHILLDRDFGGETFSGDLICAVGHRIVHVACQALTLVAEEIPEGIRLTGSMIADADYSIVSVETYLDTCTPQTSPETCAADLPLPVQIGTITAHDFRPPNETAIPVTTGQQIQVTVEIHFVTA